MPSAPARADPANNPLIRMRRVYRRDSLDRVNSRLDCEVKPFQSNRFRFRLTWPHSTRLNSWVASLSRSG
jgi:hypothetical protein